MVNFFIKNEDFKLMADTLRPVVKYAKKNSKERLSLQNICFSVIGDSLFAVATDGHKMLRYQFMQDDVLPVDTSPFHLVVQFVHIEKIVKALGESDEPLNIQFDICVNDTLGSVTLHASNIENDIRITVPAQFTFSDGPEGQAGVDWSGLHFPNWISVYDDISVPILAKINCPGLLFTSPNLLSLLTGLDKSGPDIGKISFINGQNAFVESFDKRVTGVFMQARGSKDDEGVEVETSLINDEEEAE